MEQDLYFPYVVGVSAGACNAVSYISKQPGRNKKVTIGYIADHRYLSYRNLLRSKSIFGMDFIFNELPNRLSHLTMTRSMPLRSNSLLVQQMRIQVSRFIYKT